MKTQVFQRRESIVIAMCSVVLPLSFLVLMDFALRPQARISAGYGGAQKEEADSLERDGLQGLQHPLLYSRGACGLDMEESTPALTLSAPGSHGLAAPSHCCILSHL